MLKLIRKLLLKLVDDIDSGNSNVSEEEQKEILDILNKIHSNRLSKPNYGITYSNHILKTTILVISKSTSVKEFIDTFVHEVSHIQRHIIKTYHLDSDSEQVCYMIGTIAKQLYTKCSRLFCDDDY